MPPTYIAWFFGISLIILVGFLAEYLMKREKIPDSVILILIGMLLFNLGKAPDILLSTEGLTFLLNLALMIVLFEAGLNLNIYKLIKHIGKSYLLANIYLILCTIVSATVVYFVLEIPWIYGILIGIVIGGVSSPIVIPIVRDIVKDENLKTVLFLEATFSDILVVILALTIVQTIAYEITGYPNILKAVVEQFAIGMFFGIIAGILWIKVLRSLRNERYVYMTTLAAMMILYSISELSGGSGAFASLVFGVVLSNSQEILEMLKLGYTYRLRGIIYYLHEEVTFFIRTLLFVVLGGIISPTLLDPKILATVIFLSLIFILLRYISLFIPIREDAHLRKRLSVLINRGLGAAIVALYLLQQDIAYSELLVAIVAGIILLTNLLPLIMAKLPEARREVRKETTKKETN